MTSDDCRRGADVGLQPPGSRRSAAAACADDAAGVYGPCMMSVRRSEAARDKQKR